MACLLETGVKTSSCFWLGALLELIINTSSHSFSPGHCLSPVAILPISPLSLPCCYPPYLSPVSPLLLSSLSLPCLSPVAILPISPSVAIPASLHMASLVLKVAVYISQYMSIHTVHEYTYSTCMIKHVRGLRYIGSVAAATIHDDFFSSIVKEDFQEGFKAGVVE